jgi:probable phosphoglycerate mutase
LFDYLLDRPIVYLVRHGTTILNENGKFRGYIDVPLDENGVQVAQETARFLSYTPISRVVSSDLIRATQTAQIIAECVMRPDGSCTDYFDRDSNLRPWDLGDFAGKPKTTYQRKLDAYIDNPQRKTPGGESLQEFTSNWERTFDEYVAQAMDLDAPLVIVTHTSNITAIDNYLAEGKADRPDEIDLVDPGGIVGVYLCRNGQLELRPLLAQCYEEN